MWGHRAGAARSSGARCSRARGAAALCETKHFPSVAGLKAGDEILEISNRAAATLSSSALRDFLSQPSLGLLVRTRPELEGGTPLLGSPPRRAESPAEPGQGPLAFLASSPGKTGDVARCLGAGGLSNSTTGGRVWQVACQVSVR